MFEQIVTYDEADWEILKLANEKKKFAVQVGAGPSQEQQNALERGIDNDWFSLVDVGPIAHGPPGMMMRIFKLTVTGVTRRDELKTTFESGNAESTP